MAGANPALVVRVAANLEELKKNLADGTATINTTTAAMGKLASSFSGDRLIQNAQNVVAAVNQIGGASKLTEAEQARVNATLEKALDKYRLLGLDAPQAMVALAAATKQVEAPTDALSLKMVALGSFIGTMAANAVTALIRMATEGLKAVASGLIDLVMLGPKISGIENSFQTLAASVNASGAAMLGAMREGTRGLVTDLDLMTAANKAVLLGLPVTAKEMGDLSATATILGRAMGLGPTQAFGDLITALGRSSPLILDNLGLTVKVGEANATYAAQLGKTATQLTDAEQKTAFYNAAMVAARAKVEALGQQHNSLGDSIARAGIWWENFNDRLSIAIARSPVLAAGMDSLAKSFDAAFGVDQAAQVQRLSGYVNAFAISMVDAAQFGVEAARVLINGFLGIRAGIFLLAEGYTRKYREMIDQMILFIAVSRTITQLTTFADIDLTPFDRLALKLIDARKQLDAVGVGFEDTSSKAMDSAGVINAGLDKMQVGLGATRAAMVAAMLATQGLAAAADTSAKASVAQGAATVAAAVPVREEVEKQIVEVRELAESARVMGNSYVTAFDMAAEAAAKLLEQEQALRAEERKRQLESRKLGGAFDVTSQNFEQALQSIATSGGWNPSGMGSNLDMNRAYGYARAGYSMQEIIAIFNREKAGGSGPVPPPQGPRIPGFAGGVQNFEGGLARVHRDEMLVNMPRGTDVIPASRSGGTTIVHFHITHPLGTPREIWAAVEPGLMQSLRESGMRV